VLILEVPDGFVLHGLAMIPNENDVGGRIEKESYTFLDEDVARFMEESRLRRGTRLDGVPAVAGPYERALRVLGAYIDQQQPRDVFLMEQEGSAPASSTSWSSSRPTRSRRVPTRRLRCAARASH
jgi:hypothetical protein